MYRYILATVIIGVTLSADYKTSNRLMEDPKLFEGDIQLDPDEKIEGKNGYASIIGGRWPNARVPYYINTRYIGSGGQRVIQDAINDYHKYTCLRFVRRSNEKEYISFGGGNGCSSPVGFRRGRVNQITLPGGCQNKGTAMHEMGHSIGLYHEQSRPDRDQFVEIVWRNIQRGMDYNFNKYGRQTIDSLGTPYDYGSMMHYQSTAFGGGRVTIQAKQGGAQRYLGNRRGFSEIDIKQINLMYCGGVNPTQEPPTPLPTQPPGGCVDFDERCKGWAADGYCQTKEPKYKKIMDRKCCLSCKGGVVPTGGPKTLPPSECKNIDNRCSFWASNGYCPQSRCVEQEYVKIMNQKCCLACKTEAQCHNRNERCQEWAERGECDANPGYMHDFCRQACRRCS